MQPLLEITRENFDKQFEVNVKGLLFTLQAVARRMVEQGRGGKIINFSSQAGRRGEALVAVYCASKAAVISLTQSAAKALIPHKINVNGIAPGVVDTPMWDQVDALFAKYEGRPIGEKKRQVGAAVPYGRMGKPEDLTGMAVFLASCRQRLRRRPDLQRRRRQLDELIFGLARVGHDGQRSEPAKRHVRVHGQADGLRRARRGRPDRVPARQPDLVVPVAQRHPAPRRRSAAASRPT